MYTINTTPAEFAQRILYLDGKPFSLAGLPYMETIMNTANLLIKLQVTEYLQSTVAREKSFLKSA